MPAVVRRAAGQSDKTYRNFHSKGDFCNNSPLSDSIGVPNRIETGVASVKGEKQVMLAFGIPLLQEARRLAYSIFLSLAIRK